MSQNNENFELVLYYTRRVVAKPLEPDFLQIQIDHPEFTTDEALDYFSGLKDKYKEELKNWENIKDDSTIKCFIRFREDKKFIENIKKFEKNPFFVEWLENSKKLIDETFLKFLKR